METNTHRFKTYIEVNNTAVMVELEVDVLAIMKELGGKAWLSKGKRSKALSGDIRVYVRAA